MNKEPEDILELDRLADDGGIPHPESTDTELHVILIDRNELDRLIDNLIPEPT